MVDQHKFKLVDWTTISTILRGKEKWLSVDTSVREGSVRRARVGKWPKLKKALVLWFGQVRARRGVVTDDVIMSKSMELRNSFGICDIDFKLSHGWLQKFKTQHGIKCYYLHGESGDADEVGVAFAMAKIPFILKKYDPEDIFNFDETDLYYIAPPSKTLNIGKAKGHKKKKYHVTLGLCTNISEEAALELGNLIVALNLSLDVEVKPIEKLSSLEYINMEGEDDFKVEYSNDDLLQLVQDGKEVFDSMEEDSMIVDSNDDEYKVVKLSEAQKYAKDLLNFMASQGS
ncbi:hypothetical protein AXG93_3896s1000 [Marchantia polymorpha subsp. ruderalis]|uniref:HTH CENPB-type domain-containing protein n=1 Tax=Marchantia polymorpha subsp. ruderalis TaxID=1480154 RepID=A0A176WKG0_MARPO|nr:hypothetical protein AXG93_3896s1000 [Marchantia polymorpha subsp. ruderalis]